MGKIPLFSVFTIDATSLPSLQDAANGAITGASWDASLDNAQSRKFVEAFKAKYKRVPSQFAAAGFDAALLLDVAVRKAGAQATNNRALAAAVKAAGSEFQSVRGAFKFNKNNMPIHDYYMFKVDGTGSQQRVRQLGVALQNHADAYHTTCAMK
jgi:branched-chain amino acid transport system substrate-binding protein